MKTSKQAAIEEKFGKPLKNLLPELMEQHGSVGAVAIALEVSQPTISLWLKICGLKLKTIIVSQQEPA